MTARDVFHEGEIATQERAGERATALRNGRMVDTRIMAGARPFLAAQRMLAVAASDDEGQVWASLWFGAPGFVRSDNEGQTVHVAMPESIRAREDPVAGQLRSGQEVGLLAIELASRRRLRINGVVSAFDGETLELRVEEAFPNCPKYIQRRHVHEGRATDAVRESARGEGLEARHLELIARVDTAFVGSRHPTRGVDASHRGGHPGFIHMLGAQTLRLPDYPGNSMFQTLGNLAVDPRAGMALVDFEHGRVLSLTGTAAIAFGAEDPAHPTAGTGRYWSFTVTRWVERLLPSTLRWELLDRSTCNPSPFGIE